MSEGLYHVFAALGNALFNSFWQMGVLWIAISVYLFFHKGLSASGKSWVNFLGLLTGFIAFVTTFFISLTNPQPQNGLLKTSFNWQWLQPVLHATAIIYLVLLLIPMSNFLKNYLKVHKFRGNETSRVPGVLKLFTLDAAAYLGIKRKVTLLATSLISSPFTIGFLKPVVLLPVALINHLTPQQLETIILHELAHIKRNDYLINLITQLIVSILYFNPFAKAFASAQELERERSADNWVLRYEYNPSLYAGTLLALAKSQLTYSNELALHISGNDSLLLGRVQSILGCEKRHAPKTKKLMLFFFVILISLGYNLNNTAVAPQPIASTIGSLTFNNENLYQTSNPVQSESKKYQPVEIPAIDKENSKPAENMVYLKQYEDGATGKIEVPQKAVRPDTEPAILFVDHSYSLIPELSKQEEEKVLQSIETAKQVVTEYNWKRIEKALAETVSQEQKQHLKDQFTQLVDGLNWEANANRLRASYKEINWKKLERHLKALDQMVNDSLSQNYAQLMQQLSSDIKAKRSNAEHLQKNKAALKNKQLLKLQDTTEKAVIAATIEL